MNFFNLYTHYIISLSLTAAIIFLLACLVFNHKSNKRAVRLTYVFYSLTLVVWSSGQMMALEENSKMLSLFWVRYFCHSGVVFIPILFIHFVLEMLGKIQDKKRFLAIIYLFGFVFFFLNIFSNLLVRDVDFFRPVFEYVFVPGILHPFFLLFFFTLVIYGNYLLFKSYRLASGTKKNQFKYLFLAMFLSYLGGVPNFALGYRIQIPILNPFGTYLLPIHVAIIAYAIVRHRLMDIRVAVTRAGIALAVYTVLFGIPFYLGAKFNNWVLSTTVAVVLAAPAPLIYSYFRRKAEAILLAQQHRYQKVLLQAGGGMIREHNLTKLFKLITYMVKRVVGIQYAVAFSHDPDTNSYPLKALRDHRNIPEDIVISQDSGIIDFIKNKKVPVMPQEMPLKLRRFLEEALGTSFDLVVPSMAEGDLLGFLVLGEKIDKSVYNQDDINVFKILAQQAALAIENCRFFEEFKKAQEKIFNAEKLASIGGMADGVAHQIKNRLNHFSIASGELKCEVEDFFQKRPKLLEDEDAKKSLDYMVKITDSLLENVKRTDGIVKGILGYSRAAEKDIYFGYFSVQEILGLALELLQIKHRTQNFPLVQKIECSDQIWGIKAQIMETFYNLLDNGYEATTIRTHVMTDEEKESYKPKVTLEITEDRAKYYIRISDNGIGIKDEERLKMFAPFFTTKSSYKNMSSGTGIGMYVVKRLIEENHHGKIHFESEYLKGTTFLIELPKISDNPSKKKPENAPEVFE